MASCSPIIAADYPVLMEVIDHDSALVVAKDDVDSLEKGVLELANDPTRRVRLAEAAAKRVQSYTWANRAQAIHAFIQSRSSREAI